MLPAKFLVERNILAIKYTNIYDNTGVGFHRFVDPLDNRIYLNTDFEPFDAHRLFPAFDQPDLRATYKMVVTAPEEWKVITNSKRIKLSDGPRSGTKIHTFKKTKPFSTYLVALIAGPYHKWRSRAGKIRLGIYTRKSMKKYMDPKEFFDITKKGFKFFNRYFGISYPFGKYDQIFIPEYNHGAMENVAAVTFNERRYVFRHTPTEIDRQRRASTLLHEMAHMWFGNLVTMKWWDDLWLNESFATFAGNLAMTKATRFKGTWEDFYMGTKSWAYWQDQLVTTHPIVANTRSTEETFSNFDGITYGKGAAALKQLNFYIGSRKFRKGMRFYFKNNKWKNTTLNDFLVSLEEASGKKLRGWSKEWLESSGVNTLEARWSCSGGMLDKFDLIQGAANKSGKLRTHKTQIALYYKRKKSKRVKINRYTVSYSGRKKTVDMFIGKKCPQYVFPNYKDYDYTKVYLDQTSLKFIQKNISKLKRPFERAMAWGTLWGMVRDQKFSLKDFVDMTLKELPKEKTEKVVSRVLKYLKKANNNYLKGETGQHYAEKSESLIYALYRRAKRKKKKDLQLIYFDAYVHLVQTQSGLERLSKMLKGNLRIDQPRRWNIIVHLAAHNYSSIAALLAAEQSRDGSDLGKKKVIEAKAAAPNIESKKEFWNTFVANRDNLSLDAIKAGIRGFVQPHQTRLLRPFTEKYFDVIEDVYHKKERAYASNFIKRLFPSHDCVSDTKERSNEYAQNKGLGREIRKMILELDDELGRCIRIRRAL